MLWIGITGPMGSGKSEVAEILRALGFPALDADQVAREVLSPGGALEAEVLRTFGGSVRDAGGKLDRRALGRVVFADRGKLLQLEALIHPRVREAVALKRQELAKQGHAAAFYDVPLLFEKKMQDQFDRILVVDAPEKLRHERLAKRSQMTYQEIEERSSHHLPIEVKKAAADFVIQNAGDRKQLEANVRAALTALGI